MAMDQASCLPEGEYPALGPGQLAWVIVSAEAAVDGDEILLGQVACLGGDPETVRRLASVSVGAAPLPGGERQLQTSTINLRLRQAGIDDRTVLIAGPNTIKVRRQAASVDAERLREAILQHMQAALPAGAALHLEFESMQSVAVPAGDVAIRVTRVPSRPVGAVSFGVDIVVDGKVWKSLTVRAQAVLTVPAWVATATILPGETIGPHNAQVRQVTVQGAMDPAPVETSRPVRANRIIRPDTVIEARFVDPVPDAPAGKQVTVVVERPGLVINAVGILEKDAMVGDVVTVRNVSSGQLLTGTLVSADRVVVSVPK